MKKLVSMMMRVFLLGLFSEILLLFKLDIG